MTWKRLTVAVVAAIAVIFPQPAVQPGQAGWWSESDPNGRHDWPLLGQCWVDRFLPHAQRQAIFSGLPDHCRDPQLVLRVWCDWRADYPSRYWVEQGCGRIADWPADFGHAWWGSDPDHPARLWVEWLRAGGQP